MNTNVHIGRMSQAGSTSEARVSTAQQMNQAIQTLHREMAEAQAQINRLALENQLLKAQADSRGLKVNNPEEYRGDRRCTETFLLQCRAYFDANPIKFPTEELRVKYATNLLRGEAFEWFKHIMKDHLLNPEKDQDHDTKQIYGSWGNFEKALRTVYGELDEEKTAELQLQRLTQKGSAADYAAKFQRLSSKTQWNDEALLAAFRNGLKDHLKDDLARLETPPKTMDKMITTVIRIDNRVYERKLEKMNGRPLFFGHKKNNETSGPKKPYYGPMPMELDAVHRKRQPANSKRQVERAHQKDRTAEKFRELREKRNQKCFNCDQMGHWARDCTKPKREKKHVNLVQVKETPHGTLSWTACYNDNCPVHESEKDGAGWYPRQPKKKSLNMMKQRKRPEGPWKELQGLDPLKPQGTDEPEAGPSFKKESSSEEESDSEPEGGLNLDQQPVTMGQLNQAVTWLDYQGLVRHNEVVDRLSRLIVDFGVYARGHAAEARTQREEQGTQTEEKQELLEEYIPPGSLFNKEGTMATPEGLVVPAHLRKQLHQLQAFYRMRGIPELRCKFDKLDRKQFRERDPLTKPKN